MDSQLASLKEELTRLYHTSFEGSETEVALHTEPLDAALTPRQDSRPLYAHSNNRCYRRSN